jgi:four helix bundle protein
LRRKHHDLIAWQQGIALVKGIYRFTAEFPESERFGLTSQMRRAAVSVPSNIAEGVGRNFQKERIQFLAIARGSLTELETHLIIARELGYSSGEQELLELIDRVFALLNGLMNAERRKVSPK